MRHAYENERMTNGQEAFAALRRCLAVLAAFAMVFVLLRATSLAVRADESVYYMAASVDSNNVVSFTNTELTGNYTTVTSDMSKTWSSGWYVVSGNVQISDRIEVNGTVNLILCDGAELNAQNGIHLTGSNTLVIYGQEDSSGRLTAAGTDKVSGIGGNKKETGGNFTIHGGIVTATGGQYGAGIGGGMEAAGGTVNIYGGSVTATSRRYGAGIGGGGNKGAGGTVNIYGGDVAATGGDYGAGIGGGSGGSGGTVNIYGGSVRAIGARNSAGIGGANGGRGGAVTIEGGTVIASGGDGADGIGRGGGTAGRGSLTTGSGVNIYGSSDNQDWAQWDSENDIRYRYMATIVHVTSLAIDKTEIQIFVGDTEKLNAIISPELASDKTVTWSSSDESVATVDQNGQVRAVGIGTATITAESNYDSSKKASCTMRAKIPYIEASVDSNNAVTYTKTTLTETYTVVTSNMSTTWSSGWYVVSGSVQISDRIEVSGTVNLILCDGAELNTQNGIHLTGSNTLVIYGQEDSSGRLTAAGTNQVSGIGGNKKETGGNFTIHGGIVTATGGQYGAGIGGGNIGAGGTVNIYGGSVSAASRQFGAGIGGGGNQGAGGTVNIYGGDVAATGGDYGAGIGGGSSGNGGTVNIYGGKITVTGGKKGAGIGGANGGRGADVKIEGGTVIASGGDGADGIGRGGSGSNYGSITTGSGVNVYGSSNNKDWTQWDSENDIRYRYMATIVHVASLMIDKTEMQIFVGDTEKLKVTVSPDIASDQTVTWSSSDESVAAVDQDGRVTAAAVGTALITVTSNSDSTKTASCSVMVCAFGDRPISYIEAAVNADNSVVYSEKEKKAGEYYLISEKLTIWKEGWYAVSGEINIESRVEVSGTVHLILCDGAKLNAKKGIRLTSGNTLTVYEQKGKTGELIAAGDVSTAGIGGNDRESGGSLVISGGSVTAIGGEYSAGIGGGDYGAGEEVTINGGSVTAIGGILGAGIGGGCYGFGGEVTINGGSVNATGGPEGSGIGGGNFGAGGEVTINGGIVTATGEYEGSGIGGGFKGAGGNVTINGGIVLAAGGEYAVGIGGGNGADSVGTLTTGSGVSIYGRDSNEDKLVTLITPFDTRYRYMVIKTSKSPSLTSHSLTLSGGQIGINFILDLGNYTADALTVEIGKSGEELTAGEIVEKMISDETENCVSFYVNAGEMTDTIDLTVSVGTIPIITDTYSVRQYYDDLMNLTSVEEKTINLVKALLTYGGMAQTYWGYNTDRPANEDIEETLPTVGKKEAVISGTLPEGISSCDATLLLETDTSCRANFVCSGDISDYTFKVDGRKVTAVNRSGINYYIEKEHIQSYDLDEDITFEISDGTSTWKLTYSPMVYAYTVQENYKDQQDLVNVVKALCLYNQRAKEFRQS